jgi:hypothetical protein
MWRWKRGFLHRADQRFRAGGGFQPTTTFLTLASRKASDEEGAA